MTPEQLKARFPQIPPQLFGHPILDEIGATFGELLASASKPSNCSSNQMTRGHLTYMKLIAPMEVLKYGFIKPEQTVAKLQGFIEAYRADPAAFVAEMTGGAADAPGGCEGEAASA